MPASALAAWLDFLQTVTSSLLSHNEQQHSNAPRRPVQGQSQPGGSQIAPGLSQLSSSQTALLQGLLLAQATACYQLQQQDLQQAGLVKLSVQQTQAVLQQSKQGKLTGAAATALGQLLRSALQGGPKQQPAQPSSAPAEQTLVESCGANGSQGDVKEAVVKLCEAGRQVGKLPSAAAAKQGISLGLAALLGGPTVASQNTPAGIVSPLMDDPIWKAQGEAVLEVSVLQQELGFFFFFL